MSVILLDQGHKLEKSYVKRTLPVVLSNYLVTTYDTRILCGMRWISTSFIEREELLLSEGIAHIPPFCFSLFVFHVAS